MAMSVGALNSYTITSDSSSSYASFNAITATGLVAGRYYRLFYYITGRPSAIYTNNYGYLAAGTSIVFPAYSNAFPNDQILGSFLPTATQTGGSSATRTTWYVSVVEYLNVIDYNDYASNATANSSTSDLIVSFSASFRSTATISSTLPLNLETTSSMVVNINESSDLSPSYTKVEVWVNTTKITTKYYTSDGNKTVDLSSFITAMKGAITAPDGYGDLKLVVYSGWTFVNGTYYSYSYTVTYTDKVYKSVAVIDERNLGDNYPFPSPNGASYFYLFARNVSPNPIALLANGNYDVYIDVWLYNATTLSGTSFSVTTATIDGTNATLSGFPTTITASAGTTAKLGTISRTNFTASTLVRTAAAAA